jgi:hypothetical protein
MWNKEEVLVCNKYFYVSLFLSRKVTRETRLILLRVVKQSGAHPVEDWIQKKLSLSSLFLASHHLPLKTIGRKSPGTKINKCLH